MGSMNRYLIFFIAAVFCVNIIFISGVVFGADSEELFGISNVYARTSGDGEWQKDALKYTSSGFGRNVNLFGDRPNMPCVEAPSVLQNCGYILSTYTANTALQKPDMPDCVKFDINKSATVYLVGWTKNVPNWINEYGWAASEFTDLKFLNLSGVAVPSVMIYEKHFEVSAGALTVFLGGVVDGRYFSVFVKEDNLIQEANPLSEEEIKNPNLARNLTSRLGDSIVMLEGIDTAYINGRKSAIDIESEVTPILREGVTFVPFRFLTESLNGVINYHEPNNTVALTINDKELSIDLGENKITDMLSKEMREMQIFTLYGRILVPLLEISEAAGFYAWQKDGLIVISKQRIEVDEVLARKITALFVTPVSVLDIRLKYARPGDEIRVANGVYSNIYLHITGQGEENAPITIKAQTPGGVEFTGNTCMVINGSYMVVDGFYFNQLNTPNNYLIGFINGAVNCRLTNSYFYKCRGTSEGTAAIYMSNYSAYNRVDHCAFESMECITHIVAGVITPVGDDGKVYHNRFDHNYYKDVDAVGNVWPGKSNGLECFMLGSTGKVDSHSLVEYNLFENVKGDGSEIISNKSNKNIYRYNTFLNNYNSGATLRAGSECQVYGNYFINGRSGLRVYDGGHLIYDNYFYNMYREAIRIPSTDNSGYSRNENLMVSNNTIINPGFAGILLGDNMGSMVNNLPPKNIRITDNLIVTENGHAVLTHGFEDITYENNIVRAIGNGSSTYADALAGKSGASKGDEVDLVFNGQIFEPRLEGRETVDIGARESTRAEIMTVDTVGPVNKWWVEELKNPPADYKDLEPTDAPYSYTSSTTEIFLPEGGNIPLAQLAGYASYSRKSYDVAANRVEYELAEGEGIISINDDSLNAISIGDGKIKALYKGMEAFINVNVIPCTESYKRDFDSEEEMQTFRIQSGIWNVEDGQLKIINTNTATKEIIDNSVYFKENFKLSCNVNARRIGSGAADAFIIIGETNNIKRTNPTHNNDGYNIRGERYIIGLGDSKFTSAKGIFRYDGYLRNKIGDILVDIHPEEDHQIEVIVKNGVLTVFIDGVFAGTADTGRKIEGRIGYGSFGAMAQFDNIAVTKETAPAGVSPRELEINAELSDLSVLDLTAKGLEDKEGLIYKWTSNGMFMGDSFQNQFNETSLNCKDPFLYDVKAYNEAGDMEGRGELLYDGPHEPEGMFYIANTVAKNGAEESYISDSYITHNNGLSNQSRFFTDRVYLYANIPKEFENAAYIRPAYVLRTLAYCKNSNMYDWMKFDINNKSATVYVVVFATKVPGWIYDQQWTITPHSLGFVGSNNTVISSSYIYKKHFTVPENGKTTVILGGTGETSSFPYGVIVVPDKN